MNEETITIGKRLFLLRLTNRGYLYISALTKWELMPQGEWNEWEKYAASPGGISEYNLLTNTPKKELRVINKRKEECKQSSV
jgi:hypothetical protein